MNRFFFITSYDNISGMILSSILNTHPNINCQTSFPDPLMPKTFSYSNEPITISIDKFIELNTSNEEIFHGNAQQYSAFELQYKTLIEKTIHPYRKVNLVMSPTLRINFLLKSWISTNVTPSYVLSFINQQLSELQKKNHSLFSLLSFHYFHKEVINAITIDKLADLDDTKNQLFALALAKMLTFETADLPTPGKMFSFEEVLNNQTKFIALTDYLTDNALPSNNYFQAGLQQKLDEAIASISEMEFKPWEPWQTHLLNKLLEKRLFTIYYPHIDKPLAAFFSDYNYKRATNDTNIQLYSKLLSIQLNSNRPAQLAAYFDNIEETADHPEDIEVLVNIDEDSLAMKALLDQEIPRRKFTLKYIETPRPPSFCDLWKPINKLLEITDPNAYFLLNISDEMFFSTPGWDSILKKYVGFFPDHLFRLRASRNKLRNYFDRWECSFAQDAIPITTKRWVDVGGDWNPCFGPDSFQQLISLYLAKEGMFSNNHYLRELPIIDIHFAGDVPAIGISPEKAWKHTSDHLKAMEICQSPSMQREARRRAMLIKANIIAYKNQLTDYEIVNDSRLQQIQIVAQENNNILFRFDYKVNKVSILLTNWWRRLYFNSYFGDGKEGRQHVLGSTARYLFMKYRLFFLLRQIFSHLKNRKRQNRDELKQLKGENVNLKELYQLVCLENEKLLNPKD
jgi:hypothetical protein